MICLCCFGFDSFENGDFGGLIGKSDHEFVFTIRNEGAMNVQMNGGVGYLESCLCLMKNLTIIASVRMFRNVISHTQPAVFLLKFLHLVFDGHIWMPLLEITNDRLLVLEGQIQSFERGDIVTTTRTVDPSCSMLVDKQIAIEVLEFDLVVRVQS